MRENQSARDAGEALCVALQYEGEDCVIAVTSAVETARGRLVREEHNREHQKQVRRRTWEKFHGERGSCLLNEVILVRGEGDSAQRLTIPSQVSARSGAENFCRNEDSKEPECKCVDDMINQINIGAQLEA